MASMVMRYVIQIYLRIPAQRELTGTAEALGKGTRRPFSTIEELWNRL